MSAPQAEKTCTKCLVVKPLSEFPPHKQRRDGRGSHCRACHREACRLWQESNREKSREAGRRYYEANSEKVREGRRRWYAANPEKGKERGRRYTEADAGEARLTGGAKRRGFPIIERFAPGEIFERGSWVCQLCDKPVDPELKGLPSPLAPTIDHIVPVGEGGVHSRENVQLLHRSCNNSKGARVAAGDSP